MVVFCHTSTWISQGAYASLHPEPPLPAPCPPHPSGLSMGHPLSKQFLVLTLWSHISFRFLATFLLLLPFSIDPCLFSLSLGCRIGERKDSVTDFTSTIQPPVKPHLIPLEATTVLIFFSHRLVLPIAELHTNRIIKYACLFCRVVG